MRRPLPDDYHPPGASTFNIRGSGLRHRECAQILPELVDAPLMRLRLNWWKRHVFYEMVTAAVSRLSQCTQL